LDKEVVMAIKSTRRLIVLALSVLLIGLFLIDSSAQRRRRRQRARRPSTPQITNPAIYQPATTDDMNANANTSTSSSETGTPAVNEDPDAMKQTIQSLSSQVDKLSNKINQMEESQRTLVDLERLSRAEQRSAALWKELRDVEAQQTNLQSRSEELTYALKPENIERSVVGYGTTRPEDLREQRRKQLENEKGRVDKQLEQLAANHARLEQAIAAADAEVDRLRKRLDAADQAALENSKTRTQSEGAGPVPSPTPDR
jgi:predicted  nucleic acid-binding Zn-ribbon protein